MWAEGWVRRRATVAENTYQQDTSRALWLERQVLCLCPRADGLNRTGVGVIGGAGHTPWAVIDAGAAWRTVVAMTVGVALRAQQIHKLIPKLVLLCHTPALVFSRAFPDLSPFFMHFGQTPPTKS